MTRSLAVGVGICIAGLAVLTAWAQEATPTPAETTKLATQDAEYIQGALGKSSLDKKNQSKVRIAAFLIAHYAQSGLANPALRDKALALLKAVEGSKLEDAKKLAEEIAGNLKAGAGAKITAVDLSKNLDLEILMRAFSGDRQGGFNLEKQIDELGEQKGTVPADEAEKIQAFAHKVALIGTLTLAYTPEKDEGKKTRKAWIQTTQEQITASAELAAAAQSKQGSAIAKAAGKLGKSCTHCHDIFR